MAQSFSNWIKHTSI